MRGQECLLHVNEQKWVRGRSTGEKEGNKDREGSWQTYLRVLSVIPPCYLGCTNPKITFKEVIERHLNKHMRVCTHAHTHSHTKHNLFLDVILSRLFVEASTILPLPVDIYTCLQARDGPCLLAA